MAAPRELRGMKFGNGVKWRAYDDGVVVYVPASCETHVLPPHFAAFFRSVDSNSAKPTTAFITLAADSSTIPPMGIDEPFLSELVALKILDAGN